MILVDNCFLKISLLLSFFLLFPSCSLEKKEEFLFTGKTMGTSYSIKIISFPSAVKKEELERKIEASLKNINMEMSTYIDNSKISLFNRSEANVWFDISSQFWKIMNYSFQVFRESKGAFDITVGPIVNVWGFGPEKDRIFTVPSKEEIEKKKALVGMRYLKIRKEPRYQIQKSKKGIYIDLSAIAKGYGVDVLGSLLESLSYSNYLVEIGGDIRTRGFHINRPWSIAIERAQLERGALETTLVLKDMSIATSGDYRNYHEIKGKSFSHIIDPRTARPVDHKLASVSVLHKDCVLADAWATALLVLGEKEAYRLAVEKEIAAIFIIRKGEGFQIKESPKLSVYRKKHEKEAFSE